MQETKSWSQLEKNLIEIRIPVEENTTQEVNATQKH